MTAPSAKSPDGEPLYLGGAIEFFLDAKRAGGRGERTLEDYRKKLELFQRWLAGDEYDVPYDRVGPRAIEAYLTHLKTAGARGRPMADSSRKNQLAVLKSFCKTVSKRLKVPDPFDNLDEMRFHQKAPKRTYLTKKEAGMLLAAVDRAVAGTAPPDGPEEDGGADGVGGAPGSRRALLAPVLAARDHAAFSAMMYAGLRIEETTALTLDDLAFLRRGERADEVRVARGKGNKERAVPASPKLKHSLKRYLKVRGALEPAENGGSSHVFLNEKGGRVSENTLRRRLYLWARKSSLRGKVDVKPHDLRRTFATWYLQDNPGEFVDLAKHMGHTDLSQVMKYALSDAERARAGVRRL